MRPSRLRVRQNVIPLPARISLLSGIPVTTANSDLQAIAFQRCLYHRPTRILDSALKPIFMPRDAPEGHEVCYENRVQRADGFARSGSFLLECDGIRDAPGDEPGFESGDVC